MDKVLYREAMRIKRELKGFPEATNLVEYVYEYVKDMILRKKIQCGEKIPEEMIVKQLGISRTPIREALRKLSNEGLINIYPKRFAEVVTFDDQFVQDLGTIRLNLDTLAAQLAIQNGSNSDFYKMSELADQCYQAAIEGDIYNRIKRDCDFHLMLTEIGGNFTLLKFQKELYSKVHLLQASKYNDIAGNLKTIEEHRLIVKYLMERDVDEVIKNIQKHLIDFYNLQNYNIKTVIMELGYKL